MEYVRYNTYPRNWVEMFFDELSHLSVACWICSYEVRLKHLNLMCVDRRNLVETFRVMSDYYDIIGDLFIEFDE